MAKGATDGRPPPAKAVKNVPGVPPRAARRAPPKEEPVEPALERSVVPLAETTVVPPPQVPPPPRANRLVPTVVPIPGNAAETVNNVMCREITSPDSSIDDSDLTEDPTLLVMDNLVSGIVNGTDIEAVKGELTRLLASPREKAEVISAMLRTHDFWRVRHWMRVRHDNELRLFKASRRGDLTTAEAIAFLRIANAEIETFRAEGKTEIQPDSGALLDKMDNSESKRQQAAAESFAGTTPHGREIVRRRLAAEKKKKALAGK